MILADWGGLGPIAGACPRAPPDPARRARPAYGAGLAPAQGAAILLATEAAGYGLAAQLVGFIFAGTSLAATPLTLRSLEARVLVLEAVANIAFNIALVPVAGVVGAIIAINICYGIALVAALVGGRKLFPLPLPIGAMLTTGFNSAAMVAAVLILKSRIAVSDGGDFRILLTPTAEGTITYAIASLSFVQ